MKHSAVNATDLVRILGNQCSPDFNRSGYVIGPDITGRLCHIGSYRSMEEAKRAAEQMNAKQSTPKGTA